MTKTNATRRLFLTCVATLAPFLMPIFSTAMAASNPAQAPIEWEVVNRFTLFSQAADFERLENAWSASGLAADTVNTPGFTRKLRQLLPIDRTAWRPETGTYDKAVLFPTTHQIRIRAAASQVGEGKTCHWKVNGVPLAADTPCTQWVIARVPTGAAFSLAYTTSSTETSVASENNTINEKLIVGLGDSFASGEGNPDYPATFNPQRSKSPHFNWYFERNAASMIEHDAAWWDPACHRSLLSWQALAALREAMRDKQQVVQFASFACSGAEVYDGFLRAQLNPPGVSPYLLKNSRSSPLDGLDGLSKTYPVNDGTHLRLSQQHAMAVLLCRDDQPAKVVQSLNRDYVKGPAHDQFFYGPAQIYGCPGGYRKVYRVLSSLGGNDAGFSGVVTWTLIGKTARFANVPIVGSLHKFGLDQLRNLKVIAPEQAAIGVAQLPSLYEDINQVLTQFGIEPDHVQSLVYPDPTQHKSSLNQCNRRTRDGNKALQLFVESKTGNPNFLMGINETEYGSIKSLFIDKLQEKQLHAFSKLGWRPVRSNPAFTTEDHVGHGYCSVAETCSTQSCPSGDLVRFWNKPAVDVDAPDTPPFMDISTFDAYDSTRARGMRYGNDAILSMAIRDKRNTGRLQSDWMSGSAHPTANVHALIADSVDLR
ncbi:hypothetical protein [Burkholderia contaminans]|uniref:Uncharacterized protein n=1 Tax=Burkholderia contaminans TaxID=488447 RepID=A0A3N8Q524_9BURK|nr:hypothetical protein [Burkholderia contaminans]RQT18745.1 hypothetical protein DF051_09015 [Burkholderia contaminans]